MLVLLLFKINYNKGIVIQNNIVVMYKLDHATNFYLIKFQLKSFVLNMEERLFVKNIFLDEV